MEIALYLGLPLLVALVSILFFNRKIAVLKESYQQKLSETEREQLQKINQYEKDLALSIERLQTIQLQANKLIEELNTSDKLLDELKTNNVRLESENKAIGNQLAEQTKEFERLQKQATTEFENIANKILKRNTEDLSEVNQKRITDILAPLKEKILTFEKKVEDTYEKGLKDQTDLKAELKKLYDLNNRISNEANNLTRALKGDVKQQGNWGEIVLERVLERSGLTEGQEFEREVVAQNAEGKTIRPDVIVNLPDKKHIIIDSKVSLIAYERYTNSDDPDERVQFMKEHLISLKNHIKELQSKHYNSSPSFNSPDFVLLFLPIEASFSVAVEQDQQLFSYAWDNKVVIVSPSTLLATLRTIASIWQQENQTRNAMEIARQSGALYDKFVGFITDMDRLGKNIDTVQKTFDEASKKLYTGSGNLVRRVENLKGLGAATSKQIPEQFVE
jgi:DNA recombination protein RmuC